VCKMGVNAGEVRMNRLSHKNWWVVGLVASLAIVVVAVVQAAIPDTSGAIHACYRSNGNLRLVDNQSGRCCGLRNHKHARNSSPQR
jgi:hypothetical protein